MFFSPSAQIQKSVVFGDLIVDFLEQFASHRRRLLAKLLKKNTHEKTLVERDTRTDESEPSFVSDPHKTWAQKFKTKISNYVLTLVLLCCAPMLKIIFNKKLFSFFNLYQNLLLFLVNTRYSWQW